MTKIITTNINLEDEIRTIKALEAKLEELKELKEELFNLRFRHAIGQLENSASLKTCKKDIAKVMTILREREIAAKA